MKRIARTTAPHPISGHDADLELFQIGPDAIMRATAINQDFARSTIIYPGKTADAVIRETGLFWHLDAEAKPPAPIEIVPIASAPAASFAPIAGTSLAKVQGIGIVTVYDDGTGRALLQRVEHATGGMTFTWKSPDVSAEQWIEANREGDWTWHSASAALAAPPAAPAVDDDGFTIDPDHVHFQAKKLSIGWAVTYQDAPRTKPIDGGMKKRSGMRWPLLVAADFVEDAEDVCKAAAAILERNKAEMGAK